MAKKPLYEWTGEFDKKGSPRLKRTEDGVLVVARSYDIDWDTVIDPFTGKPMSPSQYKVSQSAEYAPGKKYDQGKTRWDLVPWEAVEPLADILTFGSQKYGDNSWQNVDNAVERYKAALFRHLIAWCKGERKDPESGRSHLHHVLTNCVFLIWFELHGYCAPEVPRAEKEEVSVRSDPVSLFVEVGRSIIKVADVNRFCSSCTNCEVKSRTDRRFGCRLSCRYLYLNKKDNTFYCPQRDLTHDAH